MTAYWGATASGDVYGGIPAGYGNAPYPDYGGGVNGITTMNKFASHCGKSPTAYGVHENFTTWQPDPFTNARAFGAFCVLTVGVEGTSIAAVNAGTNDAAITSWATTVAAFGQPIMIRPWWEMNGNWGYPWQTGAGVSAAQYVSAWQRFRTRCDAAGANNLSWLWCPNAVGVGDPLPWYPGDAYVDWVGFDNYNKGGTSSPWTTNFGPDYAWHAAHTPSKPIAIGEVASIEYATSSTKPNWITAFLASFQSTYPNVKLILWYNDNNGDTNAGTAGPDSFPIEATSPTVTANTGTSLSSAAFASGISSSYFLGNIVTSGTFPSGAKVPLPGAAAGGGYTPTVWVNGGVPAINATNLNHLKNELASQALAQGISHSLPTWVNGTIPAVSDPAPLNEMERVADLVAASLSLSYTPTTWSSGWIPARNATNLNHLENQAQANRTALAGGGSGEPTPSFYYDFDFVKIADPPYTSVQWDNDPGADGPGAGIQATPDGYSVSLVNAPVGGGRALRFEIRDADGGWPLDTTGMRSQVRMDSFHTWNESPMVVGDIRWFLFEMYLPNNSPAGEYFDWGRGNYNTWMGLHPDTGNTSGRDWGCFDIGTDGPYTHPFWMTFKIAGGGGVNPYDQLEYPRLFQLTNADGSRYAPNYNRRIRVLLGGKFSPIHANGWYEAWVDGVNVLPRTAHATMWTGDTVTYFKCGPYKSATNPYPTNGKTVMYWTRIAFGT